MDTLGIKINHRHLKDSIHVHSIMDGMEEVMFCRYTERGLLSTPHLLSCFMALSEDLDIVKWFIQLVPFYFHTNCAAQKRCCVFNPLRCFFIACACLTNAPNEWMTINSRLDGWKKKELGRIMIKMIQYQTKPWRQPMLNINRQTDPQNIGHLTGGLQRPRKVVLCIQWHYLSSNEM